MSKAASAVDKDPLSHNLLGQRLGRKGRDTRERILLATETLLAGPPGTPISLSAVAREASLGMTTLYLYFSDLPQLLMAVLEPIMASAEQFYLGHLRSRWPDRALAAHCLQFIEAYHAFWVRHSRILHLRNAYADNNDAGMRNHRIEMSKPLIDLFVGQMDGALAETRSPARYMATVLLTGIERMITVATDVTYPILLQEDPAPHVRNILLAEARLLELAITDARKAAASA